MTGEFKSIVGNDKIRAEHKGKDAFDFYPFVTNLFAANKIPPSVDRTTGYLDRWIVVKFPRNFSGREDPSLKDRLTEPQELEGVLVWAMAGLQRIMARGRFALPGSVQAAMDEFAAVVDPVRGFLKECALRDADGRQWQRDVYRVYYAWATAQGIEHPMTKPAFNQQLLTLPGITRVVIHGADAFAGFTLTKGVAAFPLPSSW